MDFLDILQKDMLFGRKEIMDYLGLQNWDSLIKRIEQYGCPVLKIRGRWEASKIQLWMWRFRCLSGGKSSIEDAYDFVKVMVGSKADQFRAHSVKQLPLDSDSGRE